jgi:hypothetical protein
MTPWQELWSTSNKNVTLWLGSLGAVTVSLSMVDPWSTGSKNVTVTDTRLGRCLGPEGNGVNSGGEGEGGPGPPNKEGDKQSTPSKEGGNMEWEGKKDG